jgi:predicted dienelactone hydrolase
MNHHHRDRRVATFRGLAVVTLAGLLAAGCASDEPSTTSTPATSTPATTTPATTTPSLAYAAPGEHAVGYRVFTTTGAQEQPLTVRAWYPAVRTTAEPRPIDYAAPNKFGEQITPGEQITSVGQALADAQPEQTDEPYPLVVFSHGFSLSPIVYSTLVEHYASHGYVVLAPEHNEGFDGALTGFWEELIDRPVDIQRTIDYAEQLTASGEPLAGMIDLDNVAVVGHSYGGYTALAAGGARFDFAAYKTRCAALTADDPLNFFCAPIQYESDMAMRAGLDEVPTGLWPSLGDPRVTAVISLAGDAYPFDQRGLAELDVPIMAMGGTIDDGTPYTWGTKLTYDNVASENKTLVSFPGAGHFLFVDPCETLPWVENSVYRDAICTDAVWDTRPLDIVTHYTTAFLRDTLNGDPEARATLAGQQPHLDNVEYTTADSTAPSSTVEPVVGEYELVAGQSMPGSTESIPAPGEVYDGIYFAYLHEGAGTEDPQHLQFDVLQAFSGADCAIRFGDQAPQVCTPIGTDLTGPTVRVELAVAAVPVSVRDLNSQASYSISGGELVELFHGAGPAASAPTGFGFSGGFGFLLTYDAGVLIRIDQPATPGEA